MCVSILAISIGSRQTSVELSLSVCNRNAHAINTPVEVIPNKNQAVGLTSTKSTYLQGPHFKDLIFPGTDIVCARLKFENKKKENDIECDCT